MKHFCIFLLFVAMQATAQGDDEVWLMDLPSRIDTDAISRDGRPDTWIAVDYEIDRGKGVMLFARGNSQAPRLSLPLGVSGWHEIRLGIYYGMGPGHVDDRVLGVKLSGDASLNRIGRESYFTKDGSYPAKDFGFFDIAETLWKCADLTGQDLVIGHPPRGEMAELESNLTYVRLVPMTDADVQQWKEEQPTGKTKRLMASYDAGSMRQWGVSSAEDFLAEFAPMRDSDFDIVTYGMARGSSTLYPSKVGDLIQLRGAHERGKWVHACIDKGLDPLAEAIKAAHACGLRFFPRNRLAGPQLPPKHLRLDYGGKLLADHPEWFSTHPNGEPTRHLSFAFAGVRDFHVRLMREWVEDYGADGVAVLFSRSQPFVYYEQPVCDAFEEEYGEDMRELPVGDPRVQRTRANFITQFLRDVRDMLDEVGAAQGRYIPNCYLVPVHNSPANKPPEAAESSLAELLFNALDVESWIREGLVDYLDVHLHMYGEHDGTAVMDKIREITSLAEGTETKVFVDIYPRRLPPRVYRKIALNYYDAGADGLAFWDTYNRYFRHSEWAFVKRLGHAQDLQRWEGKVDDYFRTVPLRRLDGFVTDQVFSRPTDG